MGIVRALIIFLIFVNSAFALLKKKIVYSEETDDIESPAFTSTYQIAKQYGVSVAPLKYRHFFDLFESNLSYYGNKVAIVEYKESRPYARYTYQQFHDDIHNFACALQTFDGGVKLRTHPEERNDGKFRLLGIYASNSYNWLVADLAAQITKTTSIILHAKFGMNETIHALNESKVEWLCAGLDVAENLLNNINDFPHLTHLIIVDDIPDVESLTVQQYENIEVKKEENIENPIHSETVVEREETTKSDSGSKQNVYLKKIDLLKYIAGIHGIKLLYMKDLIQYGKMAQCYTKPNFEDANFVVTIVYTSGTMGKPKGVMLTNSNIFFNVVPLKNNSLFQDRANKIHFSYLPMSHIYERINVYLALILRTQINIWSKDISMFAKDLYAMKPDMLVGVPKIFAKIYQNIVSEIEKLPCGKKKFVSAIIQIRKRLPNVIGKFVNFIFQLSKRIKDKIDPNLKIIISGGGKISPKVEKELYYLINVRVYQGYGLTESTGPIFLQKKNDHSFGNVGGPTSPHVRFRLASWETYSATGKKPRGELQLKGETIFAGYFLRKEETKNAFTSDGFFKTGDIFQLNPNGSISFLDRSKSLIKLSQGEYIEAETLNNLYTEVPFINFCVVYGDESMDKPIAIVSVDANVLLTMMIEDNALKNKNVIENFFSGTLNLTDKELNAKIYTDYVMLKMMEVYKTSNLNAYNIIKDIYITAGAWTTENYLTHTMKVRRFKVLKDYDFFIQQSKNQYAIA